MLLVGTRRGWWAGLMLVVWLALVFAAFNLDQRSRTRLALAVQPYRDLATMSERAGGGVGGPGPPDQALRRQRARRRPGSGRGPAAATRRPRPTPPTTATSPPSPRSGAGWAPWPSCCSTPPSSSACWRWRCASAGAFERSLATGLAMLIGIPFWLATLGGVRVIPLTGVAAAFAAHGGAKLLASALAVGDRGGPQPPPGGGGAAEPGGRGRGRAEIVQAGSADPMSMHRGGAGGAARARLRGGGG